MIGFIEDYKLENLRIKILVLYLLNVTDILFTLLLLSTGNFIEANIFMVMIVGNPMLCLGLKIVFVALLLKYICIRMERATIKQLRQSNLLINGILTLYTLINICHLTWIFMYFWRVAI